MSKKIIFVGPQEVGKSTLRKWLFEGESIFKLLENPLEPTYGFENYSYTLLQNIGVFDLAGQEMDRWFNKDKTIFNESDIILNILDARHATRIITDYIEKAIKLQTKQSPSANIFFMIHKIDLVDEFQLVRLKKAINLMKKKEKKKEKKTEKNFKIYYTSIKPKFLINTVNAIVDIFKIAGVNTEGRLNTNLIKTNANLFKILHTQKKLSFNRLITKLEIDNPSLQTLVTSYEDAEILRTETKKNELVVILTEKGEQYYHQVLNSFGDLSISDEEKEKTEAKEIIGKKKVELKPEQMIYGILISDDNGKTLLTAETKDNSLKNALNRSDNPQFDLELIPMFLNAMSKFAEEINVKDLSGFKVQGVNLKMSSFSKKGLTLTVFSFPELNLDLVIDDIQQFFDDFLTDYSSELDLFMRTGNATAFIQYIPIAQKRIISITKKYKKVSEETPPLNIDKAKKLYTKINGVNQNKLTLEQNLHIKSLKVKLLETILSENMHEFLKIESKIIKYVN